MRQFCWKSQYIISYIGLLEIIAVQRNLRKCDVQVGIIQSEEDNEMGNLGELSFSSENATKAEQVGKQGSEGEELGWSSEKPETWPTDGPDCEADHLASYGVFNNMDLVCEPNTWYFVGN